MLASERRVPRYEHHVVADEPSVQRAWDDLKTRTGLKGTGLVSDAAGSWRGTMLGRNRYAVLIVAEVIEVEVAGRSDPMPPTGLIMAPFDARGLVKVVEAIRKAEIPPPPPSTPERAPLDAEEH